MEQTAIKNPNTGQPYSDSTNKRRASTVVAWIRWIINTYSE